MSKNGRGCFGLVGIVLVVGFTLTGCKRDVRLAGRKIRSVSVGAVTHYGVALDKEATPEQVAYVVLRAIRDDFLAKTPEERDAALDVQLELSAAGAIQARNRTGTPKDEFVYNVVYHWTPTVSHYVKDFETDFEAAKARLRVTIPRAVKGADAADEQCHVLMEVKDPSGDPNAQAVMVIRMVREQGYWRVTNLGFEPTMRKVGK